MPDLWRGYLVWYLVSRVNITAPTMRISIIRKTQITKAQLDYLRKRVSLPEHAHDIGPCSNLDDDPYAPNLFIIVHNESQKPIGILHRGGPKEAIEVGWWIDSEYRGQGYGSEAVDLFAELLIEEEGVTGVGNIRVVTYGEKHTEESIKLRKKFIGHFIKREYGLQQS